MVWYLVLFQILPWKQPNPRLGRLILWIPLQRAATSSPRTGNKLTYDIHIPSPTNRPVQSIIFQAARAKSCAVSADTPSSRPTALRINYCPSIKPERNETPALGWAVPLSGCPPANLPLETLRPRPSIPSPRFHLSAEALQISATASPVKSAQQKFSSRQNFS